MGADLAINPAAVLTDRRHLNAERLTDGTATLTRTNQSDQGNFPGKSARIAGRENKPGNQVDTLTPDSLTPTSKASSMVLQCRMVQPSVGTFPAPGG
jgi:hypothetical protein